MCHWMPRRHLPEWKKEDERAFVHCGSSGLNYVIACNRVCHKAFQDVVCHFIVERVCKTREEGEEEENTITFRLKCIVIA